MSQRRLSVLVPTYNQAGFLTECLDSVLAQDYPDFEVVVLDNCSSDATGEIAGEYARRDPRVRYLRNPKNVGIAENCNRCIAQARGEFLKFVFSDDRLATPHALSSYVRLLDDYPGATLGASALRFISPNSVLLRERSELGAAGLYDGQQVIIRCLEVNRNLIGPPTGVVFRADDLPAAFDPAYEYSLDVKLWFQFLACGALAYTDQPLCDIRYHRHQQTARARHQRGIGREHARLFREIRNAPWLRSRTTKQLLLTQIRLLRKQSSGDDHELAQELRRQLGHLSYYWCWLIRELRRPFVRSRRHRNRNR